MALVCPVGHPDGPGQAFCPLCGRGKVQVLEAEVEQLVAASDLPELHPEPVYVPAQAAPAWPVDVASVDVTAEPVEAAEQGEAVDQEEAVEQGEAVEQQEPQSERARSFAGLSTAVATRPLAGAAASFVSGAVLAGAAVYALA